MNSRENQFKKEQNYYHILTNISTIRNLLYNILNVFSLKQDNFKECFSNYDSTIVNSNQNSNKDIPYTFAQNKLQKLYSDLEKELIEFNKNLTSINEDYCSLNRNNIYNKEIIESYESHYNKNLLIKKFQDINNRTNFLAKFFNAVINSGDDYILREYIIKERTLMDFEHIHDSYKQEMERKKINTEKAIKDYIAFKYKGRLTYSHVLSEDNFFLFIDIFIISFFHIYLKIPISFKNGNIEFNSCDSSRIIVIVKENNEELINDKNINIKNIFSESDRKKMYINFYQNNCFWLIFKMDFISKYKLYQKLGVSLYNRIRNIFKDLRQREIVCECLLMELIKSYIDFVQNYNEMFKVECGICHKKSKYSFDEKCFFPPYYKVLLKIIKKYDSQIRFINYENNKDDLSFTHEECFRKIADPNV